MINNEKNVTIVYEEDKKFINDIINLAPEKRILIKGILIGFELQEKSTKFLPVQ